MHWNNAIKQLKRIFNSNKKNHDGFKQKWKDAEIKFNLLGKEFTSELKI